jgi:hypothetical protein
VVAGAVLATRWVALAEAQRLLPLGVVLGLLVPLLLVISSPWIAALLLMLVGGVAGFFVVPMNALLQHRGCTLLTAGRSIAVQGFNENAGMLLMLGVYAAAIAWQVPLALLIGSFAVMVTGGMLLLWLGRLRPARVPT